MVNDDLTRDVDLTTRTEDEWSRIYRLRLGGDLLDVNGMDEFEWAWRLQRLVYQLLPDDDGSMDAAEQMEARAMKIAREVFATADVYERRLLRTGRYTETKYVTAYRAAR